jgi:hypothetical protein
MVLGIKSGETTDVDCSMCYKDCWISARKYVLANALVTVTFLVTCFLHVIDLKEMILVMCIMHVIDPNGMILVMYIMHVIDPKEMILVMCIMHVIDPKGMILVMCIMHVIDPKGIILMMCIMHVIDPKGIISVMFIMHVIDPKKNYNSHKSLAVEPFYEHVKFCTSSTFYFVSSILV